MRRGKKKDQPEISLVDKKMEGKNGRKKIEKNGN